KMFDDPKCVISSIQLTTSGSTTPITVTKANFTKDANGNYVLTKAAGWPSSGELLSFRVDFDHFPANIASATADYSFRVEGEGNLAGFRDSLTASFATNYKDNTLNIAASDTDVARLYFAATAPALTSYAFWNNNGTLKYQDADDTTSYPALDVPLNVGGVGFAYRITNNSISEIKPGILQSDDFARVSGTDVAGLIADKIILSEKMVEDTKTEITSILLYTSGSTTPITVTTADFTKDANGNYVLTKAAGWASSGELLKFEINFGKFSANVATGSNEYYAAVEGTSKTIEKNRVDGIFKTNYTKSYATSYNRSSTEPAVLNVNIPEPKVNADVFMKGGSSGYTYADPFAVPVNQNGVGFRYRLANPGISTLVPGKFGSGTFVDISGSDVEKFITEKITLSGKLVDDVSEINSILLYTTKNPSSPITLNTSDFTKDANGNYVLTKEDGWASSGGELLRFEIKFDSFKEGTAYSDDIFIMAEGYTNVVKQVRITATFNTDYTTGNTNVSDVATMNVSSIDPILTGKSFCDKRGLQSTLNRSTSTSPQTNIYGIGITDAGAAQNTVANQDEVRYEFYIENGATPSAGKGNLKIDLTDQSTSPSTNVGNKGTAADPATKGFKAKTITVSGYTDLCDMTEIKLYNYGTNPATDPADVTIPISSIDITGDTFTIDVTKYPQITYLADVVIEFNEFYGYVTSDNGQMTIKVTGTADWYEYLDAKLTFTPYNTSMQDKIVSVADRVYIQRPIASLQVDVKYYDLVSKDLYNSANRDSYQKTLGVPYDRDFHYEIKVGNDYISKLEDFDLTINLPINNKSNGDEANTGFHTTGIELKKNLIDQYDS
ncbi:MAG: hypothetical protein K2J55_00290, partial [Eubacterium sp.]|nr:hypothetical protein [Eubacterium sp.]